MKSPRKSIAVRLLRVVFSCYLIVTVIVTSVQLYLEYENIEESLLVELFNVSQSFSESIGKALWNVDIDSMQSLLAGLNKIQIIDGVTIEDHNGEIQYYVGEITKHARSVASNRVIIFNGKVAREKTLNIGDVHYHMYEYSFEVMFRVHEAKKPKLIGRVYLYSSRKTVISRVADSFLIIIINALIKTGALWVIFLFFVNRVIAKPLGELSEATHSLKQGGENEMEITERLQGIIQSNNEDELQLLAVSFLEMKQEIIEKIDNLNSLNEIATVLAQSKSKILAFEVVAQLVQSKYGCEIAIAFDPNRNAWRSLPVENGAADSQEIFPSDYLIDSTREIGSVVYVHQKTSNVNLCIDKFITDPGAFSLLYLPLSGINNGDRELWFIGDIGKKHLDHASNLSDESLGFLNVLSSITSDAINNLQQREIIEEQNLQLEQRVETRTKELALVNQKLKHLAVHDPLTGLPNRILFHDRLDHLIYNAYRENKQFAVANIDLTKFKFVNDTYGHDAGDIILREVGKRFSSALRKSDTLARMGGDEFAAIISCDGSVEDVEKSLRRMTESLKEAIPLDEDNSMQMNANIGIAFYPLHATDRDLLMKYSDMAMYHAKRSGRDYAIFNPEKNREEREYLKFMSELEHAINNDQLEIHYQPIINLKTRRMISMEALVRWDHPQRGFIPPGEFIPLAEKNGLIEPLTDWVVRNAVKQCSAWHARGIEVTVSVNLSLRIFSAPDLSTKLVAYVDEVELKPCYLKLEITETSAMTRPEFAMGVIKNLKKIGFPISIDDFGTGYSSLAYLTKLPLDELKIDSSFILSDEENSLLVIQAIIELGHALKLHVIAEGIESLESLEMLAARGCDAGQGFYIARPADVESIDVWLEDHMP